MRLERRADVHIVSKRCSVGSRTWELKQKMLFFRRFLYRIPLRALLIGVDETEGGISIASNERDQLNTNELSEKRRNKPCRQALDRWWGRRQHGLRPHIECVILRWRTRCVCRNDPNPNHATRGSQPLSRCTGSSEKNSLSVDSSHPLSTPKQKELVLSVYCILSFSHETDLIIRRTLLLEGSKTTKLALEECHRCCILNLRKWKLNFS